eukprot:m.24470 g.24470  ORF g.24470 m.24470 type:complete len:363 (-) comp14616_c0_seq1:138-1226(-)
MIKLLVIVSLSACVQGHGLMLTPLSRNAREGLLTKGGSMWFSQGCTIGCPACNVSAPTNTKAGDLCPEYHGPKKATVNDPKYTTWNAQGVVNGTHWTAMHPWRAPGSVAGLDPCGVAGGSGTNNSKKAGGFGPETGYPQGFPGSRLPPIDMADRSVWTAGAQGEVAWVSVANHGGGYIYNLCPASEPLTEDCFARTPLQFVDNTSTLRYIYVNDTTNKTETMIEATRFSTGTLPVGSMWTKNPIPSGSFEPSSIGGNGMGNSYPPQFTPPEGCDEHCWGYQPCNYGFTHPSWEGWNRTHPTLPPCAPKNGQGCCHTSAYVAIVDQVKVPVVPAGDYVVRWRWDGEQSPQIWSGCGDISIVSN